MRALYFSLLFALSLTLFSGCGKDNEDDRPISNQNPRLKEWLYAAMLNYYLWYDEIPSVNPLTYLTAHQLLDDIKYTELDKWSFLDLQSRVDELFQAGEYVGYGFLVKPDITDTFRIAQVYDGSPAHSAGLYRGCALLEINGSAITPETDVSQLITSGGDNLQVVFRDSLRQTHNVSMSRQKIEMKGVIYKKIYPIGEKKAGYLVFDSFLLYALSELSDVMSYFQAEQVDEMIVDLRYNGGGYDTVANVLASSLLPDDKRNEVFYRAVFNDQMSDYNENSVFVQPPSTLNLNRVIFITSEMSASASELVINGLKPHMDVVLIGSKTYGKPVGMVQLNYGGWALLPVVMKSVNSLGQGDYYNGIEVDAQMTDDLSRDFGDTRELCLHEALYYLENGHFSGVTKTGTLPLRAGYHEIPPLTSNLIIK